MAQNASVNVPARTWTEITNANATNVTLCNVSEGDIYIQATVGAVAPTGGPAGIKLLPGNREVNKPILELFPGVAGANRLYAYAPSNSTMFISHA